MKHAAKDFTVRMQQILILLLKAKAPVPLRSLAEQVGISRRTVQRELESVDSLLARWGLSLHSKVGCGIWLDGSSQDRETLLTVLEENRAVDVTDKQERRKHLLFEILKDKKVKKLYYYSALLGVSEATVSSDLEALESWLAEFHLNVVRKPGFGISIDGSEADFRHALYSFIGENTYQILDEKIVRSVISSMEKVQDKRLQNLTENSYMGLVLHVAIAVSRIAAGELMETSPDLLAGLREDEDFALSGMIAKYLEEELQISVPQEEIAYICLHIKAGKVQQYEWDAEAGESSLKYQEILDTVYEMIDRYDSKIAYALKQDEEFVVHGLAAHLQPTLVRLQNHMNIKNPLLENIKKEYADVFVRCQDVVKVIKERFGYEVPEAEVGFIAIHFGAALVRLENRKESKRKVAIGVVCASGIGISRLMISKMNHYFLDRVEITAYAAYELNPYALERLDFLVSTVSVSEDVETLFVSPLLTEEEMERIEQKVRFYERTPKKKKEDNEFTRQLEQVNYVAVELRTMMKETGYLQVSPEIGFYELVTACSRILTPHSDQQSMILRDIQQRERLGTQAFPQFGFALLHAKTKGVKRPCFFVCQAEGHVPFQNPYFQGIDAAVLMLLPDDEHTEENRELLGFLSSMLVEEEEFLSTIRFGEQTEIQEQLSRYLKRFFNQYLERV